MAFKSSGPRALFVTALYLMAASLSAQTEDLHEDVLQLELWIPIEPIAPGELTRPAPDRNAPKELLDEARWLFSGMLFGWRFAYVPSDVERGVAEVLDVSPLGQIPWGDPDLKPVTVRSDFSANRFYATFQFTLTDGEKALRSAWSAVELQTAGGRGDWIGADSVEGRKKAFDQAVKETLRNFLRPRVYNKPARIEGELLLLHPPLFGESGGRLFCTADFRLRLGNVRPYAAY